MTISGSDALLIELVTAAVRTTILAAIAGLLLTAFRVKATSLRLFTWTAVLYAGVCMPVIGTMLPTIPIRMPLPVSPAPTKVVINDSGTTVAALAVPIDQ